ncbi:unnamed protein product [Didymodactylos carnosus]|uniref:Uncharacterized protein n=1 Tax=Didymodactylos carnosus TaxID=1234261 RepID=A0A816AV50_9BILA|nr:unnamed protein product [Didymodactylos carnosus]CAF4477411.1 unnamed protein product [Didymodactylos carnosus]
MAPQSKFNVGMNENILRNSKSNVSMSSFTQPDEQQGRQQTIPSFSQFDRHQQIIVRENVSPAVEHVLTPYIAVLQESNSLMKLQMAKIDELINMTKTLIHLPKQLEKSAAKADNVLKISTKLHASTVRSKVEDEKCEMIINGRDMQIAKPENSYTGTARNIVRAAYGPDGTGFHLKD